MSTKSTGNSTNNNSIDGDNVGNDKNSIGDITNSNVHIGSFVYIEKGKFPDFKIPTSLFSMFGYIILICMLFFAGDITYPVLEATIKSFGIAPALITTTLLFTIVLGNALFISNIYFLEKIRIDMMKLFVTLNVIFLAFGFIAGVFISDYVNMSNFNVMNSVIIIDGYCLGLSIGILTSGLSILIVQFLGRLKVVLK
jgi:hypothetical protein